MTRTDVADVSSLDVLNAPLEVVDPAIAAVLRAELTRQQQTLEMIASENFAPRAVAAIAGLYPQLDQPASAGAMAGVA